VAGDQHVAVLAGDLPRQAVLLRAGDEVVDEDPEPTLW
jgi:hypothetical protein